MAKPTANRDFTNLGKWYAYFLADTFNSPERNKNKGKESIELIKNARLYDVNFSLQLYTET